MGKLSDFVQQDYIEERELIKEAGTLWKKFASVAFFIVCFFGGAWLAGDRQIFERLFELPILALLTIPFILRAWDRHKVADDLRRHREIQIDMKLNALLGLIDIKDDD